MSPTFWEAGMRWVALLMVVASVALALGERPASREAVGAETTLSDGKRLLGEVRLSDDGRLRFETGKQSYRLADLIRVRFAPAPISLIRPARLHRVTLTDDQHLTGELLALDAAQLHLRTSWAGTVRIPREAVRGLSHLPGWVPVFVEDFEGELKAWKLAGAAALSERQQTSGKRSLMLSAGGQAAEYPLATPLEAAEVRVNFHDPGETAGASWFFEAEFENGKRSQWVRVLLAGEAAYRAEVAGTSAKVRQPRSAGWHHLALEGVRGSVIVSVDDAVLWPDPAPAKVGEPLPSVVLGRLRRLRLACVNQLGGAARRGAVHLDDLSLARPLADSPRRLVDPTQDELQLAEGDQLFGRVVRADPRTIELCGRFGSRELRWEEVRGLHLQRQVRPPQTTEGEHVRVAVRTGFDRQPDELTGVVRVLDDRRLLLVHPVLGELPVERGRLQQLHWLFHGRRVEVDNGFHHLGRRLMPDWPVPRPEGLELRRIFRLPAVPREANLVVGVLQLKGPGDGPEMARALKAGGRRTEVLVNRKLIDYLNWRGERASPRPRPLSVPLPAGALKAGENELLLRQTPDADTGQYEDVGLFALALEMPR
jgi:hypothetical protein